MNRYLQSPSLLRSRGPASAIAAPAAGFGCTLRGRRTGCSVRTRRITVMNVLMDRPPSRQERRVVDRVDIYRPPPLQKDKVVQHSYLGAQTCLVVRPQLPQSASSSSSSSGRGAPTPDTTTNPYLLYIPDIDGIGATSKPQWGELNAAFDFYMLKLLPADRSSFSQITQVAVDHIKRKLAGIGPTSTAYLLGEGWGAAVAIAAAAQCPEISRLVLVNPATSSSSLLAQVGPLISALPDPLYQALAPAFSPLLGNPVKMVTDLLASQLPATPELKQGLPSWLPQLQSIVSCLPRATFAWRVALLRGAVAPLAAAVPAVEARTMVLAASSDLLVPAAAEARRLSNRLIRGFVHTVQGASHMLLQEPGFSLLRVLHAEGFYATARTYTTPPPATSSALAAMGAAGPVELPSPQEVARYCSKWTFPVRKMSSPVFLSVNQSGGVVEGLGGLPQEVPGPLILVGNHQVLAFDMNVLVEEVYSRTGRLLRGLAHPGLMRDNSKRTDADTGIRGIPYEFSNTIRTFGAVPVTPANFFRLLQRKETILLYPGGVREGFKRKNEKYQLFWPQRPEFVRMAAKFNATIVPVASVGAEDCVNILMDTEDIRGHPLLGPLARDLAAIVPDARVGVADKEELDQTFIAPLAAPGVPARLYFLLQQAITLTPADAADKERCEEVYAQVRASVEDGISYLLRMREQDPYHDFLPRYLYENAPGLLPGRRAPSFLRQEGDGAAAAAGAAAGLAAGVGHMPPRPPTRVARH